MISPLVSVLVLLDLSVRYHGGSSGEGIVSGRAEQIHFGFSDVEACETKDLWLCHPGSLFCGGTFGSSQLQGLDLGAVVWRFSASHLPQ